MSYVVVHQSNSSYFLATVGEEKSAILLVTPVIRWIPQENKLDHLDVTTLRHKNTTQNPIENNNEPKQADIKWK